MEPAILINNKSEVSIPKSWFSESPRLKGGIPRCLRITSNFDEMNVSKIKRKLRENKIFHKKYNPSLENSHASYFFKGIYEIN